MSIYKTIIRPFLFRIDPERVHYFVYNWLKRIFKIPGMKGITRFLFISNNIELKRNVFGVEFPNPVGLAAGFDKDAKMFDELSCLGFGFIEVGTVTPLAQSGNDKPRLFRLPSDSALINRMGFNNEGVESMASRLRERKKNVIIGGNIGKNKITANDLTISDYEISFRFLFPYVDYFAVNVSSPNTAGLRNLQEKEPLLGLLNHLQNINNELGKSSKAKPVLLKIAPDLTKEQLDEIIEVVLECKLNGIIATNTTISREGLATNSHELEIIGAGGLSGKPLTSKSTEMIRYIAEKANKRFAIIGVGGIHSATDAIEKIKAGADLIQLYTGFIYEGPGLIKKINREIIKRGL